MREVNCIMWRKEKRQRDEGETDRWRKLKPWETGITLLGYTECICFERTPRDRAHTTWWLREQMNSTPSPPSRLTKRLSPCCVCPSVCLKHCLSLFVGLCTVCTPVYLSFCPPVLFWQSVCLWAFICRSASLSLSPRPSLPVPFKPSDHSTVCQDAHPSSTPLSLTAVDYQGVSSELMDDTWTFQAFPWPRTALVITSLATTFFFLPGIAGWGCSCLDSHKLT